MSATDSNSKSDFAAHSGWMARLVVHLFRCRHRDWTLLDSYWMPTAWNGFAVPIEEQCNKCGEYRHRVLNFDSFRRGVEEPWKAGRHPKSK